MKLKNYTSFSGISFDGTGVFFSSPLMVEATLAKFQAKWSLASLAAHLSKHKVRFESADRKEKQAFEFV